MGFEGIWIEGQVLVGGVWIGLRNSLTVDFGYMSLRECGSEVRFWSEVCGSKVCGSEVCGSD